MMMPISEIIDRYTITRLKSERTSENVKEELCAYEREIDKRKDDTLNIYIAKLYHVNGKLWNTEKDIRNGKKMSPERCCELATKVRDLNLERNAVKAEIVGKFNEGFKEIKINYKKIDYGTK